MLCFGQLYKQIQAGGVYIYLTSDWE